MARLVPSHSGRTLGRLTLGGVVSERLEEDQNPVLKTLDALGAFTQAAAGVAEELQARREGLPSRPLGQAALRGVAGKMSFQDVTGDPITGLLLDVTVDVPVWAGLGALGKALKVGAGVRAAGRGGYSLARRNAAARAVLDSVGSKFSPEYGAKVAGHRGAQVALRERNRMLGLVNRARHASGEEIRKELYDLVPDKKVWNRLAILHEDELIYVDPKNAEAVAKKLDWHRRVDALAPNERRAFDRAREYLKHQEKEKIALGMLTEEVAAGLVSRLGMPYMPRRLATKEYVQDKLDDLARAISDGEPDALARADAKTVKKWQQELDKMPQNINSPTVRSRVDAWAKKKDLPSFMHKRKETRRAGEMLDEELSLYNLDMPDLLARETQEIGAAAARIGFAENVLKELRQLKLVIPASAMDDPARALKLLGNLEQKELKAVVRDGFKRLTIDGFEGYAAPKSVVDMIERSIRSFTDPKLLSDAGSVWVKSTHWMKAFTLPLFVDYHIRNHFSNMWNSHLAGMTIQDVAKDMPHAGKLLHRFRGGYLDLDDTVKQVFGKGLAPMTEREFYGQLMEQRVIRGGQFVGELGKTLGDTRGRNSMLRLFTLNPKNNLAIQKGYQLGEYVEDTDRLAHFLWRLRKGDTLDAAGESVRHFQFDYVYGLTDFENKYLRERFVPYWAWTKFNIPLQLEMLFASPKYFANARKAQNWWEDNFGGPEPEEIFLARWMKEAVHMRVDYDNKTDTYQYFVLDNWWPAADLARLSKERVGWEMLNMLSPIVKLVPEAMLFNYSLFRRRKIEEYPGQERKLLGVPLPARLEHMLRAFRPINSFDRLMESMSDKYASDAGQKLQNAVFRVVGQRSYPVKFEEQKAWWGAATSRMISTYKHYRKKAEEEGDEGDMRKLDELIAEVQWLREEHLEIDPRKATLKRLKQGPRSRETPEQAEVRKRLSGRGRSRLQLPAERH